MTTAMAHIGTPGLTLSVLFWNRAGWVANPFLEVYEPFDAGNWNDYVDGVTVTGIGTLTGSYLVTVPTWVRATWSRATFHAGVTESATLYVDTNPSITDAALEGMLEKAAARLGGGNATRNTTTGAKTFRDAAGTTVFTESAEAVAGTTGTVTRT